MTGAVGLGVLAWAVRSRKGREDGVRARAPVVDAPRWPAPGATLSVPDLRLPPPGVPHRVVIDAGHGAPNNRGNTSCRCEREETFTLAAARAVAGRLEATGAFDLRVSREGDRPVTYHERVEDADAWGAEAFVSLHSDVRGKPERREGGCPVSVLSPGFSVLWSDEGEATLVARRAALARRVAARLEEAGFLPYDGAEYTGLYAPDAAQRGVFLDRHALEERIFVLRRPTMPSVLVETHHALDPREVTRWDDPFTLDVFAAALGAALLDTLAFGGP